MKEQKEEDKKEEETGQMENNIKELEWVHQGDLGAYRQNYYREKMNILPCDFPEQVALMQQKYVEGLSWVFQYYYKGCISWDWYYPFHYAPFAQDLSSVDLLNLDMNMGKPFRPIDQLMAVLSPYSISAIPESLKPLMSEPSSEIIDFYPLDFKVDVKGKRFAWMGEVILPFINEARLLSAIGKNDQSLTPQEQESNALGSCYLYLHLPNHPYTSLSMDSHGIAGTLTNRTLFKQEKVVRFGYETPQYTPH